MFENQLTKDLYVAKSFFMIGSSSPHCYGCSYCRASLKPDETESFLMLPEDFNSIFRNAPVCVNAFYGDPMLQIDKTYDILLRLREAGHVGPVIIITKGDVNRLLDKPKVDNLNIHIGLSTFGLNSEYDGGNMEQFVNNLKLLSETDYGYKYHIEFRPIIRDVNDSDSIFKKVISLGAEYKVPVAYSGLQVNDNTKRLLEEAGIIFRPYEGFDFGLKKNLPDSVTSRLRKYAKQYNVDIFSKTSCLISSSDSVRDYNAHYYRPNEVGCYSCRNKDICFAFKECNNKREVLDIELPFEYELVYKDKHICELFQNGLCKFPSDDCMNISGKMIVIKDDLTTSDVRLIKWLTGYTVDASFVELPFIHKSWKIEKNKNIIN